MSTVDKGNPLELVGNLSVESGLFCGNGNLYLSPPIEDVEMPEEANSAADPPSDSLDSLFPGVNNGDFSEVETYLAKAPSQGDLLLALMEDQSDCAKRADELDACVAKVPSEADLATMPSRSDSALANDVNDFDFNEAEKCLAKNAFQAGVLDTGAKATDELDVCLPQIRLFSGVEKCLAKVPSQAGLQDTGANGTDELQHGYLPMVLSQADLVSMETDSMISIEDILEIVKQDEQKTELPVSLSGLALSPGTPAEASDHAGTSIQLPFLPVVANKTQDQLPQPKQQQRSAASAPLLNSFETMSGIADIPEVKIEAAAVATAAVSPRGKSKQPASRRRSPGAEQNNSKSYLTLCQKNRIFDSGAKARYQMDAELQRDAIVEGIVAYVKHCLDPERDRVHRFLMVMLVDGQLEQGPFWRFFQDAVYFCDSRKDRLVSKPRPMFHIRQSAYLGLLWGRFKGNECFDYATLGDAIKSVKSKPNGELYFVDPDFGSLTGKPKRLFQFGEVAFQEVCQRYENQRCAKAN